MVAATDAGEVAEFVERQLKPCEENACDIFVPSMPCKEIACHLKTYRHTHDQLVCWYHTFWCKIAVATIRDVRAKGGQPVNYTHACMLRVRV